MTFEDELKQLESYVFSGYSDDLWEYDPQAKTDEFITYLLYSYREKWEYIYSHNLQNLGSKVNITQKTNSETHNNFIQTNDGFRANLNGEDKSLITNDVTANSLNINKMNTFFTIVLDDIKKEVLIYKGE